MFIDTHTHLYVEAFDEDRKTVVERAIESGIEKLLLPNIDVETIDAMNKLSNDFPTNCYAMMGLHPGNVKEDWEEQLSIMEKKLNQGKYIAIGEIGMDLYWDKTFVEEQKKAFRIQINWAKKRQLPIVIHARDAFDEIFEILDEENDKKLRGIFHCFTGTKEQADKIMSYGQFLLGIGGVLTYKNAKIDEAIKHLSLEKIVLETDAPYLPPVPYRGKRNESAYLVHIAEKLSDVFQVNLKTIEEKTTENALKMFDLT